MLTAFLLRTLEGLSFKLFNCSNILYSSKSSIFLLQTDVFCSDDHEPIAFL